MIATTIPMTHFRGNCQHLRWPGGWHSFRCASKVQSESLQEQRMQPVIAAESVYATHVIGRMPDMPTSPVLQMGAVQAMTELVAYAPRLPPPLKVRREECCCKARIIGMSCSRAPNLLSNQARPYYLPCSSGARNTSCCTGQEGHQQ